MLLSLQTGFKFSLNKTVLLLLSTSFLSLWSLYIKNWGMKISLQSLPLIIGGWWFGFSIGLLNSLWGNLINFFLNPQIFSLPFSIQPFLISLISFLFRKIYENKRNLQYFLWACSYIPLWIFPFIFKSYAISCLISGFSLLNIVLLSFLKWKMPYMIPLYINVNACFLIIAYVVSFGLGVILSSLIENNLNVIPLISLNARIFKEIIKISLFSFPMSFFFDYVRTKEK